MTHALFHIIIVANGLFYECIQVSLLIWLTTFCRWYCYRNHWCLLMHFLLVYKPFWRPFWICQIGLLHLLGSFHVWHQCILLSYYKVEHVSHMHHLLSLHGLLAISWVSWLQDHMLLCFWSLEDSLTTFGNMLCSFGWLVMLAIDYLQEFVASCLEILE